MQLWIHALQHADLRVLGASRRWHAPPPHRTETAIRIGGVRRGALPHAAATTVAPSSTAAARASSLTAPAAVVHAAYPFQAAQPISAPPPHAPGCAALLRRWPPLLTLPRLPPATPSAPAARGAVAPWRPPLSARC